jgi:hypothetical protein
LKELLVHYHHLKVSFPNQPCEITGKWPKSTSLVPQGKSRTSCACVPKTLHQSRTVHPNVISLAATPHCGDLLYHRRSTLV